MFKVCLIIFFMIPSFLAFANTSEPKVLETFIEGVYNIESNTGDKGHVTILVNMETGQILLTTSNKNQQILFRAKPFDVTQITENLVEIRAAGVDIAGVRQDVFITINPIRKTIHGIVHNNVSHKPYKVSGHSKISLSDLLNSTKNSKCPPQQELAGLYEGTSRIDSDSDEKKISLRISSIRDKDRKPIPTAAVNYDSSKFTYHGGYLSSTLNLITFVNDQNYEITGKARKLILTCQKTDDGKFFLVGMHIASNGQIVKEIKLMKVKEN